MGWYLKIKVFLLGICFLFSISFYAQPSKVEIIEDRTLKLSLLFDPDHHFDKKVLKEQFSF